MNERDEFATQLGAVTGWISGLAVCTLLFHVLENLTGLECLGCVIYTAQEVLKQLH
jgi:hypothetical protein